MPPSQGGKYAGFGNTVDPPPRSYSTNDFYDSSVNGLTNVRQLSLITLLIGLSCNDDLPLIFQSWSAFSIGASRLTSKVSEVGWKFTDIASKKVTEVSGAVSDKVSPTKFSSPLFSFFLFITFCFVLFYFLKQVKDGQILNDITSQASGIVGKVDTLISFFSFNDTIDLINLINKFQVSEVGKSGFSNLGNLWGNQRSIRSQYEPCEDSSLYSNNSNANYNG